MLEVALASGIPELHLRIRTEIDAAVATRFGKHPVKLQFEIGVVAVSREKHAVAVVHDHSIGHLPMGGHVGVPSSLLCNALLGRALCFLHGIEVGPAAPADEVGAIEEWREARRRLGSDRKLGTKSENTKHKCHEITRYTHENDSQEGFDLTAESIADFNPDVGRGNRRRKRRDEEPRHQYSLECG